MSLLYKIPSPLGEGERMEFFFRIERTQCGRDLFHSLTWATASVMESSAAATSAVERDDWTPSDARPVTNLNQMPRATLGQRWLGVGHANQPGDLACNLPS